ncbi:MAG TPA: hypothetical protein ENK18_25945 [Deltaproteobacteria bacterium]|nr:hypothetical protein [Deltaproteobacteria bacterium]
MTEVVDRIRADLEALAGVAHRYAGTEGEREMLHHVRSRLPEGHPSRIEGFVAYTSPSMVLGIHALALLISGVLGLWWPLEASVACGLVTASLVLEGSERFSLLRRLLLKSASYNLVWRSQVPNALGTLVISAPLDRPRWRLSRPGWLVRPLRLVVVSAGVVTVLVTLRALAEPWGRPSQGMYAVALLVLATTVALGMVAHRRASRAVGGASGCAALLELNRRFCDAPPPDLDIWMVFTGCSYAYQNGMHAFLAMRGGRLAEPVFVLALADPGKAPLQAIVSEGPLWPEHHRSTGPALVERLRWAGVDIPSIDTAGATDARAALQWGYRSLALSGGSAPTRAEDTLRAVEVAEALCRLYAEDLHHVPELRPALRGLLEPPVGEGVGPVGEGVGPVGEGVGPVGEGVGPVGEGVPEPVQLAPERTSPLVS